jgi:hypothetical protein
MSSNKTTFTDSEILFYGREQDFYYQEGLSPLAEEYSPARQEGLLEAAFQNPGLKTVADYVAASFMNPRIVLKVFGEIEGNFLRYRAALPYSSAASPAYAILFSAGNEGSYLGVENKETVYEMFLELSGINMVQETSPLSLEIDPIDLLVILAACDVILQNRYEGGWFTVASILNAFDLSADLDFSRVCAPVAAIAGDMILRSFSAQDIENSLKGMITSEIFKSDEMDGKTLYCFSMKYRYIHNIFAQAKNRFAVLKENGNGSADFIYVIVNETGTWGFGIENGESTIKGLDKTKLQVLCKSLLGMA